LQCDIAAVPARTDHFALAISHCTARQLFKPCLGSTNRQRPDRKPKGPVLGPVKEYGFERSARR
jgi:hypothetical protein